MFRQFSLFSEPELELEEKLRVVMSRDPYELSILGNGDKNILLKNID